MKQNVIVASIIALALVVAAGILKHGRYYAMDMGHSTVAVLDRWTGKIAVVDTEKCSVDDMKQGTTIVETITCSEPHSKEWLEKKRNEIVFSEEYLNSNRAASK